MAPGPGAGSRRPLRVTDRPFAPASLPPIHLITDDEVLAQPGFQDVARSLLEAGRAAVALHLRGPHTPGGQIERLARALAPVRTESAAWLVINDRIDVAAVSEADGVQLGRRSLGLEDARALVPELGVGVSIHSAAEARAAHGADWVVVGHVHATPSHSDEVGLGPDGFGALAAVVECPCVAIGGITPPRVGALRASGAQGVAVLRGVWQARDPLVALDGYLSAWRR